MVSEGKVSEESDYGSPRVKLDDGPSVGDVGHHVREASEQASRYLAAQAGRLRALLRSAILFGALGVILLFVAVTIAIVGCVQLCEGIAGGIAQLLGGRQWAGDLITGGAILGVILLGGYLIVIWIMRAARKRTVASWAERKTQEPTP